MDKNELFASLEKHFLGYTDLAHVPIVESGEDMVSLAGSAVHVTIFDHVIAASTGNQLYVRRSVAERLAAAQTYLDQHFAGHKVDVVYGYRHPDVQRASYERVRTDILSRSDRQWDEAALSQEIHRFVAVPDVAGHPTGGAVDVRLLDQDGQVVDMGTEAHGLTKDSYVFYPLVSKAVWRNRQMLRQCMLAAGFAPFDGEWWHFSYGDREWAAYYGKPHALYDQIDFSAPD